jgi:hypothetical protein
MELLNEFTFTYDEGVPHDRVPDWALDNYSFEVTISRNGNEATFDFFMGQGTDGTPKLENVLECLVSDYQSYKSTASFIEWADEYGFDSDSIKALNTYNLVKENAIKLDTLLTGIEVDALQETLEEN